MVIVSGASSNHFVPLTKFLKSVPTHAPQARVICYDLGLSAGEKDELERWSSEVRRFPFEIYPPHVSDLIKYAWKPLIVRDVLKEGEPVLWCDAGNLLTGSIAPIEEIVQRDGIYTPYSKDFIYSRTMPQTLQALEVDEVMKRKRCRLAGVVALHPRRQELAEKWAELALDENIIAPPGHSRPRHHYDTSILSVLAYRLAQREGFTLVDQLLNVTICNDTKPVLKIVNGFAVIFPPE